MDGWIFVYIQQSCGRWLGAHAPWHRRRKDTLATSRVAAGVTGVTGVSGVWASGASVGGGEVQAGPTQQTGTVGRSMPAAGGEGKGGERERGGFGGGGLGLL